MVTLLILDGFGLRDELKGNAIKLAGTPHLDELKREYPYTTLLASGFAVGLSDGQMGNSEVGHLNLGAGRVVPQDLMLINNKIKSGEFYCNQVLLNAMEHTKKYNSSLHILGLCSDGGVHSHIDHLLALISMAEKNNVQNIYLHLITDGRDTLKNSGKNFVFGLEEKISGTKVKIADICGRVYAMDRENRWDRVQKAYNLYVYGNDENGENEQNLKASQLLENSYNNGIFDEFVKPTLVTKNCNIKENDAVIFFNFRTDRAREITNAISQANFDKFKTEKFKNLFYVCFTEYDSNFKNVHIAFPNEKIYDNLASVISENNLTQFHISETTKYAHVTFFINGGIEKPYKGEDRKLIESENVLSFADTPKMKAEEITKEVLAAISGKKYNFVLVKLSNADMLGHTGDIKATKVAIKTIDKCAYDIAKTTLEVGGHCIITADHGNAEYMLDENGNSITSHTANPVPLYLVSEKYKNAKLKTGILGNVAPTVLKLLNLKKPSTMLADLFE